jgi:hypothetical protein
MQITSRKAEQRSVFRVAMHSDRHRTLRSCALQTAVGFSKREIEAANVHICEYAAAQFSIWQPRRELREGDQKMVPASGFEPPASAV